MVQPPWSENVANNIGLTKSIVNEATLTTNDDIFTYSGLTALILSKTNFLSTSAHSQMKGA